MADSEHRPCVTGIGLVTPIGSDPESFWDSLLEGRSGAGPVRSFDPPDHETLVVARDPRRCWAHGIVGDGDRFADSTWPTRVVVDQGHRGWLAEGCARRCIDEPQREELTDLGLGVIHDADPDFARFYAFAELTPA